MTGIVTSVRRIVPGWARQLAMLARYGNAHPRLVSPDLIARDVPMPDRIPLPEFDARGRVVPAGQECAPTRDANPRMSDPVGQNRIPVPAGAQVQYRQPGGEWKSLGEPGHDVELRIVSAQQPQRRPYVPGT